MKYLNQAMILAAVTFAAELIKLLLPLPVPASIYGLIMLFLLLKTGVLKLRQVEDVSRYGQAVLTGGRLMGFNEKTRDPKPGTINGGVYLMTRELIRQIPDGKVSLENDMIPKWLLEGRRLGGFVNDGYFIDIGIPEDYYRFMDDVEKGVLTW